MAAVNRLGAIRKLHFLKGMQRSGIIQHRALGRHLAFLTIAQYSYKMAGGSVQYRHLSRKSSHRRALLRNLVTSLIQHESISTTWPKAKEAQRIAEKMITHAKTNTEASKRQIIKFVFVRAITASEER